MHTIQGNHIDSYAATALQEFVASLLAIRASAVTMQDGSTGNMNPQQRDCLEIIITSTERLLGYMSPEYSVNNGQVAAEVVLDRMVGGRTFPALLEDRNLKEATQHPHASNQTNPTQINSPQINSTIPNTIEFVQKAEPFLASFEHSPFEHIPFEKERSIQRWNDDGSVTVIDVMDDLIGERRDGLRNLFQVSRTTPNKRVTKRVRTRKSKLIVKEKPNLEVVTQ